MSKIIKQILILFLSTLSILGWTQDEEKKLIQFSGIVVTGDSLNPVPFTHIIDISTHRGTTADYFGYFSFVAKEGDSIQFSAVGYKKALFIIPDSLTTNKYSLIQMLNSDTIILQTAVIYPWPSKEQFAEAFVYADIPDDDYKRATANLERAAMKERIDGIPMDGSMNFKWQMQQQQARLYYAGQLPPNNLLNPIAWAKFVQAWKNGDFKKKED